jgi:hypothetical protein
MRGCRSCVQGAGRYTRTARESAAVIEQFCRANGQIPPPTVNRIEKLKRAWSPEEEGEHVPETRLPMRRIPEVLRLHFEAQLNDRQIAKICSVGKSTVRRYLKGIAAAGLSWPLPDDLDHATLEHRIFRPAPPAAPGSRPLPDFTVIQGTEEPPERHPATALGRTSFGPSGRSQL